MKTRFRTVQLTIVACLVVSLLVVACSPEAGPTTGGKPSQPAAAPGTLTIGTAPLGSFPYVVGVGLSEILNKQYSDLSVSVEPAPGADPLVRGIASKHFDVMIANNIAQAEGYLGRPPFEGKVPIRLIAQGDGSLQSFAARADSGIKTPADFKGKKVVGKRAASTILEVTTLAVLKAWGVPKEQVTILETSVDSESIEALKLGTADASILPGAAGSPQLVELAESVSTVWMDLGPNMDALLKELNPAYFSHDIAARTYKGQDKPFQTVAAGRTGFSVRADLPEEMAYRIAKAIFADPEQFSKIHGAARHVNLKNTLDRHPFPFHEGAVRYFKEAGVWTDALEKRQQELLK